MPHQLGAIRASDSPRGVRASVCRAARQHHVGLPRRRWEKYARVKLSVTPWLSVTPPVALPPLIVKPPLAHQSAFISYRQPRSPPLRLRAAYEVGDMFCVAAWLALERPGSQISQSSSKCAPKHPCCWSFRGEVRRRSEARYAVVVRVLASELFNQACRQGRDAAAAPSTSVFTLSGRPTAYLQRCLVRDALQAHAADAPGLREPARCAAEGGHIDRPQQARLATRSPLPWKPRPTRSGDLMRKTEHGLRVAAMLGPMLEVVIGERAEDAR